jgi:hypothetical protein
LKENDEIEISKKITILHFFKKHGFVLILNQEKEK